MYISLYNSLHEMKVKSYMREKLVTREYFLVFIINKIRLEILLLVTQTSNRRITCNTKCKQCTISAAVQNTKITNIFISILSLFDQISML